MAQLPKHNGMAMAKNARKLTLLMVKKKAYKPHGIRMVALNIKAFTPMDKSLSNRIFKNNFK